MRYLRAAFRNNYMNFYRGGQSIAKVGFDHARNLQAKIHNKYIHGGDGSGQQCVTLTSKGLPNRETGHLVPYNGLHERISNANRYVEDEKRFVDLVVAHNPNVIDLEMGLPAYSKTPGENCAPRADLVVLEPDGDRWRVVFWEAKLVGNPEARRKDNGEPKVVGQLNTYAKWLNHKDNLDLVIQAYQNTCRLLVALHAAARSVRPKIEELGQGIRAVASQGCTSTLDRRQSALAD